MACGGSASPHSPSLQQLGVISLLRDSGTTALQCGDRLGESEGERRRRDGPSCLWSGLVLPI